MEQIGDNSQADFILDLNQITQQKYETDCVYLGTNTNPKGETLSLNSKYLLKNNQPWFPIMGEFHFSRYPCNEWEDAIFKMKAAGIEIIATYVFWIHHEEEKGKWNWQGNNNIRFFAELCAKYQMYLFTRIGPWCHGEVRNGGHPDWLVHELKRNVRKNHPKYMEYTEKLYSEIHNQLKSMYFKDGGPIIGIQIENERAFNNPDGLYYMVKLKYMAQEIGIDVPYYTATGWQGYDGNQKDLIPVWGAYPDAPWAFGTKELVDAKKNFNFSDVLHDSDIGTDLLHSKPNVDKIINFHYPLLTAEMGAGTQCTHHRRPIFNMYDGASLILVKIGSGANGIGYYVFHGGQNPIGKISTMQESKATLYPNDLPVISYDFYAPIGEWGQIRPSFKKLKQIHYLMREFGDLIVTYPSILPQKLPAGLYDNKTLRWAVRADNERGFICINNYQRHLELEDIPTVQFNFKLNENLNLTIPNKPITIPRNTVAMLPFNLKIGLINIIYSTVQPFCRLNNSQNGIKTLVMIALEKINPEIMLSEQNIEIVTGKNIKLTNHINSFIIRTIQTGKEAEINIELKDKSKICLLILTPEQGLNAWKVLLNNKDYLLISKSDIIPSEKHISLFVNEFRESDCYVYPPNNQISFSTGPIITMSKEDIFTKYHIEFEGKKSILTWEEDRVISSHLIKSKAPTRISRFLPIKCYPLYDTVLAAVKHTSYWRIKIPKDLFIGVSNVFLRITYEGDTLAAYLNGKLIADNFFAGEPMLIGLKRFEKELKSNDLIILITPLENINKIYIEKQLRQNFSRKRLNPKLISANIIPQYRVDIENDEKILD